MAFSDELWRFSIEFLIIGGDDPSKGNRAGRGYRETQLKWSARSFFCSLGQPLRQLGMISWRYANKNTVRLSLISD